MDQPKTNHSGSGAGIKRFNAELAREWAIETGIIEGVYTLDRGITQALIERGINAAYIQSDSTNRDPELVARMIRAHEDVLEGLFAFVTGERALTTGYIKELHSALLRHQETFVVFDPSGAAFEKVLDKGAYKKLPNNPKTGDGSIHEYCPPEHVSAEMDRMIDIQRRHTESAVPAHIEAAWLHHAFTQIHPFQDGNGRVARALSSLVFIKQGFFPLVVNRDDRGRYIDALEAADRGDLSGLTTLFAQLQKRVITRAIGRAADVTPVKTVEEAVAVTRDMLIHLGRIIPPDYLKAKENAGKLMALTNNRFGGLAASLSADIARANADFAFGPAQLGGVPKDELASVATKLQYDPNPSEYHQAALLNMTAKGRSSRIVVSFHGVGSGFRGLLAVVAYFQSIGGPPIALSDDIFRISYEEPGPEITKRYGVWLDECLINGLAEWRRTLV